MRASSWAVRAAIVVTVIGLVAAIGAALAGFVLADIYQPRAAGAGLGVVPAGVRRSNSWGDWHRRASVVFLVATLGTSALVAGLLLWGERPVARRAFVVASAAVAVVTALVTSLTRGMVEWDQLRLWAVTAGRDMSGYWAAAFDDRVQSVFVGSSEVSQGQYVPALVAHLGAPVLGAIALTAIAWTLLRAAPAAPDGG